jgi:hypothetical protein
MASSAVTLVVAPAANASPVPMALDAATLAAASEMKLRRLGEN